MRREIAALARRQHGAVARRQLLRLGLTSRQVDGWVKRGELRILHRGVYALGPIVTRHTREMAAVLARGKRAAISHRSAVHLYELLPHPARPGPVAITVPGRHPPGSTGIVVHMTSTLRRHEIRVRHGIPVTAPIRTLIDFAGGDATDDDLERAVAEAFALRLTQREPVLRELERHRGRPGTPRLRALLDADGPHRTRSAPERALLEGLRSAGIHGFETNVRLGRWEVDFYWPDRKLVVEVDAYSTHSSPSAFERDRRKTTELEELGLRVRRVTKRRIDEGLHAVIAEIRRAAHPA
jgi:very-short-patch-repair endonuclease